tara:strand:+ start:197516 stop:197884 length:369 start_codon:yes stop_codon:yes gene_type:complete
MMKRLVLVDDSVVICKVAKRILSDLGFLVSEAHDVDSALTFCEESVPSVMIVDGCMEGATDLIKSVRDMPGGANVKIYYCLIEAKLKLMMQGKRAGADDFLLKPFDRQILTKTFTQPAMPAG